MNLEKKFSYQCPPGFDRYMEGRGKAKDSPGKEGPPIQEGEIAEKNSASKRGVFSGKAHLSWGHCQKKELGGRTRLVREFGVGGK